MVIYTLNSDCKLLLTHMVLDVFCMEICSLLKKMDSGVNLMFHSKSILIS